MPRIAYFAAVFLWAAVVGTLPLKAGETKGFLSLDELVEYFDSIVFQSEIQGVEPSRVVKKWTQPLRVAIRTFEEDLIEKDGREILRLKQVKVKKTHLKFIKKHLNSLIRATKLKTEDVKKTGKPPNFMINFVPRRQMGNPYLAKVNPKLLKRLASEGGCYFLVWADGTTGKIKNAIIVVNSERLLIRINHCLLEEMTQSLGLPNDSNKIKKSIFSDRSRRTELTRTDLIVLKTLYDPRMKAGLPRAEAVAVAREIIRDLDAALP
ncbi:MAG: DUF2927 domain-containing protein [Proteobacteria bacterium]|nr:DUF2927 domain-containing protein [Pseudomonadota bacterium]